MLRMFHHTFYTVGTSYNFPSGLVAYMAPQDLDIMRVNVWNQSVIRSSDR